MKASYLVTSLDYFVKNCYISDPINLGLVGINSIKSTEYCSERKTEGLGQLYMYNLDKVFRFYLICTIVE